ncbi:IS110 family transposase, partial [[Ruminococcus] torques]|nr:IS110 family transposase [[Ruminococcus] torques]
KFVCIWDNQFSAYLAKKRSEGKHYNVAISLAAKKLVRVIYQLEKSGQLYHRAA